MARKLNWNPKSQHAELTAADTAIDAALASAEVLTIKIAGKDVPASEAPLDERIKAYAAISKPGAVTQDMSELVTTNSHLSTENTRLETENTRVNAANGGLTQEKSNLTTDLATARASINTLTASNAELLVRHDAALSQVGSWTAKYNALNSELSKRCLAVGCLVDLRDQKNELLPSTASADEKQQAADRIPAADKLNMLCAANAVQVNQALAKLGVNLAELPAAGPTTTATVAAKKEEPKGLAKTRAVFKEQISTLSK